VLVDEETGLLKERQKYDKAWYRTEKDKASDAILDELKDLEGYARWDVNGRMHAVSEAGVSTLRMAFGSSVVTLLCALLTSLFVTRSITAPLRKLVKKTKEISSG